MRMVSAIFRRELKVYVGSATGYFVAATMLLLDGLLFYSQALGPAAGERLSAEVLARFFYTTSGLVTIAAVALSIRLVAEERTAGTLVLLTTAPVRDWQIVAGKFLSALTFLTGITLLSLYMPLLVLVNGRISWAQVGVGYLGLFLLGGAVLAIGLFASSLTRSQLVAAVIASAVTGTMFLFWELAQVVVPPFRGLLAGLAIHARHFQGFQWGTLHLRDVVYYLAVMYFFLFLSTKVMEARRWV